MRPLLKPLIPVAILLLCCTAAAESPAPAAPNTVASTPRLGLVLSGGGARGLAHVGVLKVLERERIPVDLIAGTSMGAIIGGLYASGMSATQLEQELIKLAWDKMFNSRVERQSLSQRRKEEDFDVSSSIELGLRDSQLRLPQGTLSTRELESLLRRLTLPVRHITLFSTLPTPFKAVATDMESGQQRLLEQGDLALAMRASMSVPGVFSPTEWDARILGDGGLVNNLPIDVARQMGATQVIAVNVGTPIGGRDSLNSVLGITAQMINILTEQNVQRSLASLGSSDVLITPKLAQLGSGDFDKAAEFIALGEQAAEAALPRLRALSLTPEAFADWQLARKQLVFSGMKLADVKLTGTELTHPEQLKQQLLSQPGSAFNVKQVERDLRFLAASGDYARVDYRLEGSPEGEVLVFDMEEKPWGPNYFHIGLDLSTDFSGDSAFNLRVSHNRHWLTQTGTEWRNQLSIGQTPRYYSELYQPLGMRLGGSIDWFASLWGDTERRTITLYERDSGRGLARVRRDSGTIALDLGQPWGGFGEIRLGLRHQGWRIQPDLLGTAVPNGSSLAQSWSESGLRLKAVIDQLDFANFPQRGYRVLFEALTGQQRGPEGRGGHFHRTELQASSASSWGVHTLNLQGRVLVATQAQDSLQGPYTLGGFQQLSGYRTGQLYGDTLAFARATYYMRLREAPVLTRGFFMGGSLEMGNAWNRKLPGSDRSVRWASSVFIGADTGVGPMYLALGHAPRGGSAVYLFIGRP